MGYGILNGLLFHKTLNDFVVDTCPSSNTNANVHIHIKKRDSLVAIFCHKGVSFY